MNQNRLLPTSSIHFVSFFGEQGRPPVNTSLIPLVMNLSNYFFMPHSQKETFGATQISFRDHSVPFTGIVLLGISVLVSHFQQEKLVI